MARCRRKRRSSTRKSRKAKKARKSRVSRPQRASYHHGLRDAIAAVLPGQFFSRWKVRAGIQWLPQRIFWLAVMMAWGVDQTFEAQFDTCRAVLRALFPSWSLGTTYTGWYEAQRKWIAPLGAAVAKRMRQQLRSRAGKHWQREGWCAFAVDGSRIECPRTAANEKALGCAGRTKTGPQLFLTTLQHMGTGVPWDFRIGPGTASERRHLEDMLPALPRQSLVVADAGFTGYDLYRRLLAANQHFLLRVGANVRLLRKLGDVEEHDDWVYLWPDKRRDQPPVKLRLLQRRQGRKTMYLVTDVLDKPSLSARRAFILYEMRWGVELFFRSFKQTLGHRRMRSRSPEAARCELTWAVLGLWLLEWMSVVAIIQRGGDPLRWSAAAARDRVRQSMRSALTRRHSDRALTHDLGWTMQDDQVRRNNKRARNWPHKKTETPPGHPKIRSANAKERRLAKDLMTNNTRE